MNNEIKQQEENHLKSVLEKIHDASQTLEKNLKALGVSTLERLKELRDNPETGLDFILLLEQLHEKNEAFNLKDKFKRQEEFKYLKEEPYFSRIDLYDRKKDVTDSIYIGKFGYTEETPIVTDWRAAIASVYYRYRYPQKNVSYDSPEGKNTRDLQLKRTFEIDDGVFIKYYNNDLQLDETAIIADKIEKRTGGVLEDIVETIQRDQMDIIESDPRQVCIVQGCVGSGKSTVAIHKLSHIFFNYSNYIKPEKAILIAKNQILVGYLSTLFPKLGIFDINYKTLKDLIVNIIFRENLKIDYDLDEGEDTSMFTLKKITKINKLMESIHTEYKNSLAKIFSDPDFESFGGFKYSEKFTPLENIDEIRKELEEEISMQKEIYKDNPRSLRGMLSKQNTKTIRKIIGRLTRLAGKLKTTSFSRVLKQLDVDTSVKLNYAQTLMYVYAYSKLRGVSKFPQYEYCVVDEGQDFSLIEYMILDRVVLRGRISIFGDLNQSLEEDGITDWDDINKVIKESSQFKVFKLTTNYRSTKQIVDFAVAILKPYTKDYLPKSIKRHGEEPVYTLFNDKETLVANFIEDLQQEVTDLQKSIGVICYSEEIMALAEKSLINLGIKDNKLIKLDKTQKVHYVPQGVYYMNRDDCKGLEFSKVYVLDLNIAKIGSYAQARKAFVAVTRAMNELTVMGIN